MLVKFRFGGGEFCQGGGEFHRGVGRIASSKEQRINFSEFSVLLTQRCVHILRTITTNMARSLINS